MIVKRYSKKAGKFTINVDARTHVATRCVAFGFAIGNNSRLYGKLNNFFVEVDFLFWHAGIEIRWPIKYTGPEIGGGRWA